jgi:hypothetical protein
LTKSLQKINKTNFLNPVIPYSVCAQLSYGENPIKIFDAATPLLMLPCEMGEKKIAIEFPPKLIKFPDPPPPLFLLSLNGSFEIKRSV